MGRLGPVADCDHSERRPTRTLQDLGGTLKNGWLRAMMPVLMNLLAVALSQRDNNWNREAEH